jgi:hypothetical protein
MGDMGKPFDKLRVKWVREKKIFISKSARKGPQKCTK